MSVAFNSFGKSALGAFKKSALDARGYGGCDFATIDFDRTGILDLNTPSDTWNASGILTREDVDGSNIQNDLGVLYFDALTDITQYTHVYISHIFYVSQTGVFQTQAGPNVTHTLNIGYVTTPFDYTTVTTATFPGITNIFSEELVLTRHVVSFGHGTRTYAWVTSAVFDYGKISAEVQAITMQYELTTTSPVDYGLYSYTRIDQGTPGLRRLVMG